MILVTGATGRIGNVLVRRLVEMNHKVRVFCIPGDDVTPVQLPGVEVYNGDIRDYAAVENACEGVDLLYHLAALVSIMPGRSREISKVNVGGTINVIRACKAKNVQRLVYTGSVHAFSEPAPGSTIDESVPFNPARTAGVYGKSKAEAALFVSTAAREGLDAVIVCPTGVIGPFDFGLSAMGSMFAMFIKRKLKMIIEGSFDFVDVRDVVQGQIAAAEKARRGDVFILGGEWTTMRGLVEKMARIMGTNPVKGIMSGVPSYIVAGLSAFFAVILRKNALITPYSVHTLTRNYRFSHNKASRLLDYSPRKLECTIKDTFEWLNSRMAWRFADTSHPG